MFSSCTLRLTGTLKFLCSQFRLNSVSWLRLFSLFLSEDTDLCSWLLLWKKTACSKTQTSNALSSVSLEVLSSHPSIPRKLTMTVLCVSMNLGSTSGNEFVMNSLCVLLGCFFLWPWCLTLFTASLPRS